MGFCFIYQGHLFFQKATYGWVPFLGRRASAGRALVLAGGRGDPALRRPSAAPRAALGRPDPGHPGGGDADGAGGEAGGAVEKVGVAFLGPSCCPVGCSLFVSMCFGRKGFPLKSTNKKGHLSSCSALLPCFFWEGSPTKIDYRKKLVPLF